MPSRFRYAGCSSVACRVQVHESLDCSSQTCTWCEGSEPHPGVQRSLPQVSQLVHRSLGRGHGHF